MAKESEKTAASGSSSEARGQKETIGPGGDDFDDPIYRDEAPRTPVQHAEVHHQSLDLQHHPSLDSPKDIVPQCQRSAQIQRSSPPTSRPFVLQASSRGLGGAAQDAAIEDSPLSVYEGLDGDILMEVDGLQGSPEGAPTSVARAVQNAPADQAQAAQAAQGPDAQVANHMIAAQSSSHALAVDVVAYGSAAYHGANPSHGGANVVSPAHAYDHDQANQQASAQNQTHCNQVQAATNAPAAFLALPSTPTGASPALQNGPAATPTPHPPGWGLYNQEDDRAARNTQRGLLLMRVALLADFRKDMSPAGYSIVHKQLKREVGEYRDEYESYAAAQAALTGSSSTRVLQAQDVASAVSDEDEIDGENSGSDSTSTVDKPKKKRLKIIASTVGPPNHLFAREGPEENPQSPAAPDSHVHAEHDSILPSPQAPDISNSVVDLVREHVGEYAGEEVQASARPVPLVYDEYLDEWVEPQALAARVSAAQNQLAPARSNSVDEDMDGYHSGEGMGERSESPEAPPSPIYLEKDNSSDEDYDVDDMVEVDSGEEDAGEDDSSDDDAAAGDGDGDLNINEDANMDGEESYGEVSSEDEDDDEDDDDDDDLDGDLDDDDAAVIRGECAW